MVEIFWPRTSASKVGRISIERRILGQTGNHSWEDLASLRGVARIYQDKDVRPGVAYEYRISRPARERIETGYWTSGLNLPAEENRGVALVVVEQSVAENMAPRLDRFMLDLVGDGWQVVRHRVARANDRDPVANLKAARKIRDWIQNRYNAAHYLPHVLILVGPIPVVKSGKSNPDGHTQRPLETDLFYADTNAIWLDDGNGVLLHSSVPSDHIEMQVGRIDFSRLDDAFGDELSLLKRYFDKNHHWRHGRLGDPRQAYGNARHLPIETNALQNIVGPKNWVAGGHHDAGTRQAWLLGVAFGSHRYSDYTTDIPIKAVFSMNFGSWKLDFTRPNNTLTAMLAQSWYALATGWGGRPAWRLHHMALGKSIGYSHLRTVNNGTRSTGAAQTLEYSPSADYLWINPIWVNLLGDPTLRPFPCEPVTGFSARSSAAGVRLDWLASPAETGTQYRIYRAPDRFGPYRALNPLRLLGESRYIDSDPIPGAWYMVRAHSLKKVYAGSFYSFSQGVFASVENTPPRATDQSISTPMGQAIEIRPTASDPDPDNDLTVALIRDSEGGRLVSSPGGWSFIADAEFTGLVNIPFTVFDGTATDEGLISIDVTQQ